MEVRTSDDVATQLLNRTEPVGQVLCFVSAKGGTGKTVLSATTAYVLLKAGMRVVTIDTDFSTRGLSLFLLGSILDSSELHIQGKHCLADSILDQIDIQNVTPLHLVRGSIEYNVLISNSDVWRGGVPDERFLGGSFNEFDVGKHATPMEYFQYLKKLCDRFRKEYDYVILDTRGGYDFTSAAPATIADGYIMVLEADRVSVEQVSGFRKKIDTFYRSLGSDYPDTKRGFLKGFIVNKALFSVDDVVFPEALAREYDSKTFGVIPVDRDVVRAYQKKNIPQEHAPDSDFSYFSLQTIEHIVSPAINWSETQAKQKFYRFLSHIRSQWNARKRLEFAQQALVPTLLIAFAVLAAIFYLLFKRNSAGYSLPAFYAVSALFILLSAGSAMFGALAFMRTRGALPITRKIFAVVFGVIVLGLAYLTAFDVPKTFSQGPLLQRVRERDETITSQQETINQLMRRSSDLSTENQFLQADKEQTAKSLTDNQNQINDLQNQLSTLKVQLSSITRDRNTAQSALSSTEQQAEMLRQSLSECQRKCRAQ